MIATFIVMLCGWPAIVFFFGLHEGSAARAIATALVWYSICLAGASLVGLL